MASALVIIAEGTEEIEAVAAADVLCRCGVAVTIASVGGAMPEGRNGLPLRASTTLREVAAAGREFSAVVVPGGAMGAANIAADATARGVILAHAARGALIAAICAAPAVVLAGLGLLEGKRATGYPGSERGAGGSAAWCAEDVVTDGRVITSRGPGTAIAFGLAIGAALMGPEAAGRVAGEMLVR